MVQTTNKMEKQMTSHIMTINVFILISRLCFEAFRVQENFSLQEAQPRGHCIKLNECRESGKSPMQRKSRQTFA